jgi:hypothetical protein
MIKRPLNARFRQAVLDGRKVTTIRDSPWPIGQPIMLYSWSGSAYRSPHIDLCPVIVRGVRRIQIYHDDYDDGPMIYTPDQICGTPLWECEGFGSQEEMDAWFRSIIKRGAFAEKFLMMFRLEGGAE